MIGQNEEVSGIKGIQVQVRALWPKALQHLGLLIYKVDPGNYFGLR